VAQDAGPARSKSLGCEPHRGEGGGPKARCRAPPFSPPNCFGQQASRRTGHRRWSPKIGLLRLAVQELGSPALQGTITNRDHGGDRKRRGRSPQEACAPTGRSPCRLETPMYLHFRASCRKSLIEARGLEVFFFLPPIFPSQGRKAQEPATDAISQQERPEPARSWLPCRFLFPEHNLRFSVVSNPAGSPPQMPQGAPVA